MDAFEQFREVEFRDGTRVIPAYLADIMAGIPTSTMTMDDAIRAANRKLEADHVQQAYSNMIKTHFGGTPR